MKIAGLMISLMLYCQILSAQDSTQVSYSEVADTLVKQRFIDRYENVFMTKVPTRHMVKAGIEFIPLGYPVYGGSGRQGNLLYLGYEYKLFPSISLGINLKGTGEYTSMYGWNGVLMGSLQGRWYFDMNQRIASGKSANNFSGNYLAVVGEKYWQSYYDVYPNMKMGIEFGMQRRFFNNGAIDFAAGMYYYQAGMQFGESGIITRNRKNFEISTRTMLSFAFGDWKKKAPFPACDVFRCDEFVSSQWKLQWPIVRISSNIASVSIGIAYEKKLGKSPVSVNTQILADYIGYTLHDYFRSTTLREKSLQIQTAIQARYYFLQKRHIRTGRGGNNLSGFYIGSHLDYVQHNITSYIANRENKHLGVGFAYGYQKALFKNGYIDISGAQSFDVLPSQKGDGRLGTFRVGFGLSI